MRPNIIALSLGPVAEALENLEELEGLEVVEGVPAPPAPHAPVALPAPPAPPAPPVLSHSSFLLQGYWMDMELVSLNPDLGSYFGAATGVLVVRPPSDDSLKLRFRPSAPCAPTIPARRSRWGSSGRARG